MTRAISLKPAALTALASLALLTGSAVAQPAPAAPAAPPGNALLTEDGVIAGTMMIEFGTRTNLDTSGDLKAGSAAIGAMDKYMFTLNVAKTTEFSGEIYRWPKLFSSVLGRSKQDGKVKYNINIAVLNPANLQQKKVVGKWVGEVPLDEKTGVYDLTAGGQAGSALRIAIDAVGKAPSFTEQFGGKLQGKAEKKEGLVAKTYSRVVGGKKVDVTVTKSDPLTFQGLELAKGPAESYPRTTVNGRLDYDYETGNWLTDGIRFKYLSDGKDVEDVVTGTIKWVKEAGEGKGYYEFNLRFNEEKNKAATGEGDAFAPQAGEDAFFAVDTSIPTLTGRIEYVDTMVPGGEVPAVSKITYKLNANKLTKQQIVNFFKLWMVIVGPANDE